MAGFGSLSLTQTAIGSLLDQRAIVLYKQPDDFKGKKTGFLQEYLVGQLWGNAFNYEELFSGLLSGLGAASTVLEITGTNPYGVTYMEATVNVESDLCDHPIENGTVLTDTSIILPVRAEVTVAMPTFFAEMIYKQMYDIFAQKDTKIILQTKYGLYTNLVLQNIEYQLEAGTVDRTLFILTLREMQEFATYGDFSNNVAEAQLLADESDANTVNTGSQMALEVA